jgi:tetratricopeptide (TPR) repeat protein
LPTKEDVAYQRRRELEQQLKMKLANAIRTAYTARLTKDPDRRAALRSEATAQFEELAASPSAGVAAVALRHLAQLAAASGDVTRAEELSDRAIERDPEIASSVNLARAQWRAAAGDDPAARAAFRAAVDAGTGDALTAAARSYADYLTGRGELEPARDVYQEVEQRVTGRAALDAAMARAELEASLGNHEEAERVLAGIIELGDPDASPEAALRTGLMRIKHGRRNAERFLLQAERAGHPKFSPRAGFELAQQYSRRREPAKARGAYERVIASESPDFAERAQVLLRMLADEPDQEVEPTTDAGEVPAEGQDEASEVSVFISHASEDKASVARPLASALLERGWKVWLDEQELHVGDSLVSRIDDGLARARFGVVVLSRSFFSKRWPRAELNALFERELSPGEASAVLPVWHEIGREEVAAASPLLADRLAVSTSAGIDAVADALDAAMRASVDEDGTGRRQPLVRGIPAPAETLGAAPPRRDLDLLERLKALLPAQFDEVVFRVGVPETYLPSGAQAQRAIAVLKYVGADRHADLATAIDTVAG